MGGQGEGNGRGDGVIVGDDGGAAVGPENRMN